MRIAGVDEAGRGPWAGPVVAAAVILPVSRTRWNAARRQVRIDDSKRLTPRQRAQAFDVILERAEVGVGIVCAEQIDRHNILQATLMAMRIALHDLPTPADGALIDGSTIPLVTIPCRPIVHGDQLHEAISCASIVAKVVRDRLMAFYEQLWPGYAFHRHKGYGTPMHLQRLRVLGPSLLHRRSFRPVCDALCEFHSTA